MTATEAPTLEPIVYKRGSPLKVLNQLLVPGEFVYEDVTTVEHGFEQIRSMKVRGAPAIAIVAVLSLAVECDAMLRGVGSSGSSNASASADGNSSVAALRQTLCSKLDYLGTSRPTAVNLFIAINDIKQKIEQGSFESTQELLESFMSWAEAVYTDNALECALISRHGCDHIRKLVGVDRKDIRVLTHCNTGSLATAKHGTALGVIRFLRDDGVLERVYNTETRPYNQGARLTSFELAFERIPSTLVADSAVSFLMRGGRVDAVVVGADRICRNGDTANKIGTYQIALAAKHHGVPFFVAAPFTSIDLKLASGDLIHIEERSPEELTHSAQTKKRIVTEGIDVWNPSFDVTDGGLIAGIMTERGVILPDAATGAYDIQAWLEAHPASPSATSTTA